MWDMQLTLALTRPNSIPNYDFREQPTIQREYLLYLKRIYKENQLTSCGATA